MANDRFRAILAQLDLPTMITQDLAEEPEIVGAWAMWHCPFHQARSRGRSRSFGVKLHMPAEDMTYYCFSCGATGNALTWLREQRGMSWAEIFQQYGTDGNDAKYLPRPRTARPVRRPMPGMGAVSNAATHRPSWQAAAKHFVAEAQQALFAPAHTWALHKLEERGLTVETIRRGRLGWNDRAQFMDGATWGMPEREKKVWLPRGWVIPWYNGTGKTTLRRVNIRRTSEDLATAVQQGRHESKYYSPPGWKSSLYIVPGNTLPTTLPVIMVEGEFDALSIAQVAGDLVFPVATGSSTGGRRDITLGLLAVAPVTLLGFDTDQAGAKAVAFWRDLLPRAFRWAPYFSDASGMLQSDPELLRGWIMAGLRRYLGKATVYEKS